ASTQVRGGCTRVHNRGTNGGQTSKSSRLIAARIGGRHSVEGKNDAGTNRLVGEVVQVLRQRIFGGVPEFERQRDTAHAVALVHKLVFLGALLRREVFACARAV